MPAWPFGRCRNARSIFAFRWECTNWSRYYSSNQAEMHKPIIFRSPVRQFSSRETVTITFVDPSGDEHPVKAEVGRHLLDVAHDNNIELEGILLWRLWTVQSFARDISFLTRIVFVSFFQGACGGELACSTCHLIFDQDVYNSLPPKSDEEEDMLDLAFELTDT